MQKNTSRHDPIWMTLDLGKLSRRKRKGKNRKKPGWNEALMDDI